MGATAAVAGLTLLEKGLAYKEEKEKQKRENDKKDKENALLEKQKKKALAQQKVNAYSKGFKGKTAVHLLNSLRDSYDEKRQSYTDTKTKDLRHLVGFLRTGATMASGKGGSK